MLVFYFTLSLASMQPVPTVKNPEEWCPTVLQPMCNPDPLCAWDCEEMKCVQTSDANSNCGGMYGGRPMYPGGSMTMGGAGAYPGSTYPGAYGTNPMAGGYGARPGGYMGGAGAYPPGGYGRAPGYGTTAGYRPGYPATPGMNPMAGGFGRGAYGSPTGFGTPGRLQSIQKNQTLQQPAYGTYPMGTATGSYPRTYPTSTYGRRTYPTGSTYGRYGTGTYGYGYHKTRKYTISTTFTYALLIITPFLIICSFCAGKMIGNGRQRYPMIINPELREPIPLDPTYYRGGIDMSASLPAQTMQPEMAEFSSTVIPRTRASRSKSRV